MSLLNVLKNSARTIMGEFSIMKLFTAIIISFAAVGIILLLFLMFLPPLSMAYADGAFFFALSIILLTIGISLLYNEGEYIVVVVLTVFGILAVCAISYCIYGWDYWRSDELQKQIGEIQELKFDEHILPIAKGKLPLVDKEYAKILGDKRLGEDPGLGSQVVAKEYTLQNVNGELVWIAPLEHSGFLRWFFNDTTPGYIRVSANDSRDVQLVLEANGKKFSLKYLKSAYFTKYIKFRARMANLTQGLEEYNFEVDDEGRPYWIVSLYKNHTAWKNPDATGVMVIDAQTGEAKTYSIEEAPKWIDTIQPADFVMNQIRNWGHYVNGYFNWGNKGRLALSEGYTEVYNTIHSKEGNNYYYTGITSIGKDRSTTGILLVNKRTKEVIRYNFAGATEEAARESAMGQVQEKRYEASFPVPTVVHGVPAYFMLLKDAAGLVKLYALVSVQDHQFVGIGETLEAVERNFVRSLTTNTNAMNFANKMEVKEKQGIIGRISTNIEGGSSFYYFTFEGNFNVIYKASSQVSLELVLTRSGDIVRIKHMEPNDGFADVLEFRNLQFDLKKSEETQRLEEVNKANKPIR